MYTDFGSAERFKSYATVATDIDLVADRAALGTGNTGQPPKFIRFGGAGNVNLLMAGGSTGTIIAVLAGESLPIAPQKILASGTTATNITVFW